MQRSGESMGGEDEEAERRKDVITVMRERREEKEVK